MISNDFTFPLVLTMAFFVGACSKTEPEKIPPRPVVTYTVEEPAESLVRSFSGQVSASVGVGLSFQVGGRVIEINALEGKQYEKDYILARIDDSDFQSRLADAEASLTQAVQELRRVQSLFVSGNASQSQMDSAIAREKSARANYDLAQRQVENCNLKMPYAGVIGTVDIDEQETVSPGETVMSIQGEEPMQFEFGVPVEVISEISAGSEIRVRIPNSSIGTYLATITQISPRSSQNTTYPVKTVFNQTDPSLFEGMSGEALIRFPNPEGAFYSAPLTAVMGGPDEKQYVWVVNAIENTDLANLHRKEVKTGRLLANGNIAIVEGVTAGDALVSRGVHKVEEAMVVRLLP